MNVFCKYIAVVAALFCLPGHICSAQQGNGQQKELSFDEAVAKQVEDMVSRYKLDDYQAFKLDTLLQHYAPIYNEAMQKVKASGASQMASYQSVMDKWADFFDTEYQKIFTEKQWKLYMKSAAGSEKKKRDKRLAAARGETLPEE